MYHTDPIRNKIYKRSLHMLVKFKMLKPQLFLWLVFCIKILKMPEVGFYKVWHWINAHYLQGFRRAILHTETVSRKGKKWQFWSARFSRTFFDKICQIIKIYKNRRNLLRCWRKKIHQSIILFWDLKNICKTLVMHIPNHLECSPTLE